MDCQKKADGAAKLSLKVSHLFKARSGELFYTLEKSMAALAMNYAGNKITAVLQNIGDSTETVFCVANIC